MSRHHKHCRRCHQTGFGLPTELVLEVIPQTVNFPETPVNASSSATVNLTNFSVFPIRVEAIVLNGDRTNFGFAPQAPFTFAPDQTVPLDIIFRPLTLGTKSSDMLIISTANPEGNIIRLRGVGV